MSAKNTGGPAFPAEIQCAPSIGGNAQRFVTGMSLRDWFAGQALSGGVAFHQEDGCPRGVDEAAEFAYRIADSMLAERSKP